jgi:RNA polymerase sigma-70 factor (ECF subfamily)
MRDAVNAMSFSARWSHMHMTALELNDQRAFGEAVEPHRRELQLHCYRMLGSFEESEDLTQETFLRAWRRRETYAARASVRAWLYKIATNACLDVLAQRPHVPTPTGEMPWLQPYPDTLLDDASDVVVVERETIELAFMIAIQYLAPRPRAVLILRDVLGWRARDVASLLDVSVAAVNSALVRARDVLKEHLPADRGEWAAAGSEVERSVVDRYIAFTEAGDAAGIASLMHADARFMMPPETGIYHGPDAIVGGWVQGGFGAEDFGDFRLTVVRANHAPALVNYLRKPDQSEFHLLALDVLRIEDGRLLDIIAFSGTALDPFELPRTLPV